MSTKPSFLENLKQRRVLPIVGMYIGATWLVIELGDWVTERFSFSSSLTSYVFIAMLTLLPAVILFAYNHGAPGKDEWTKSEKIAIPLNLAVALSALYFISPSLNVEAAIQTVQIPDETGVIQEFEVARQGYHKEVIAFFWRNETGNSDLDWLSYGLPVMLAKDLNRVSPVISVDTPFGSSTVRSELKDRGFDSLLDEPQGLRVEIARDRRSAALIVGSFAQEGETMIVDVTLFDAATGDAIGSHTVSGADWLTAVDDVSQAVLNYLGVEASDNQSDDPVSEHFSNSLQAIRHYVNGHLALDIQNDYPQGITEFQAALELDPLFAEASGTLSRTYYLNGDVASASSMASQALANSYRLSETNKFLLKANRYMFDGEYERAQRVIEIWTQVQSNSTQAFRAMAFISQTFGGTEGLDKAIVAYDRLLELDPNDLGILREKAEVEQQRGDYDAAAGYLRLYLESEPDSGPTLLQLANIYQAQGDLDAAQEMLEDAAILSDNPLNSEIGLARIEARRGLYDAAEERLAGLSHSEMNTQQHISILSARIEVALVRGRVEESIAGLAEISELAKELMPPMVRLLQIESQKAGLIAMLGRTDEAIRSAEAISAQLQPPLDSYQFFTYTAIHELADNRAEYREWVDKVVEAEAQLPEPFKAFIKMQAARIAIWDGNYDLAVDHTDRAKALLGLSMVQLMQSNLNTSSVHVDIAKLYFEAGAVDKARIQLQEVLKVFPSFAYAKLVSAKVYREMGNEEVAKQLLVEALEVWSVADVDYILSREAKDLLGTL